MRIQEKESLRAHVRGSKHVCGARPWRRTQRSRLSHRAVQRSPAGLEETWPDPKSQLESISLILGREESSSGTRDVKALNFTRC